jgi:hypothetical protein
MDAAFAAMAQLQRNGTKPGSSNGGLDGMDATTNGHDDDLATQMVRLWELSMPSRLTYILCNSYYQRCCHYSYQGGAWQW